MVELISLTELTNYAASPLTYQCAGADMKMHTHLAQFHDTDGGKNADSDVEGPGSNQGINQIMRKIQCLSSLFPVSKP